ncbi:hypothetical protein IJ135_01710 [Candidatus Saccharibacteria bacterium]|nr:hypothetical protein [Candidatus Saccharibacteria bacterium]
MDNGHAGNNANVVSAVDAGNQPRFMSPELATTQSEQLAANVPEHDLRSLGGHAVAMNANMPAEGTSAESAPVAANFDPNTPPDLGQIYTMDPKAPQLSGQPSRQPSGQLSQQLSGQPSQLASQMSLQPAQNTITPQSFHPDGDHISTTTVNAMNTIMGQFKDQNESLMSIYDEAKKARESYQAALGHPRGGGNGGGE